MPAACARLVVVVSPPKRVESSPSPATDSRLRKGLIGPSDEDQVVILVQSFAEQKHAMARGLASNIREAFFVNSGSEGARAASASSVATSCARV